MTRKSSWSRGFSTQPGNPISKQDPLARLLLQYIYYQSGFIALTTSACAILALFLIVNIDSSMHPLIASGSQIVFLILGISIFVAALIFKVIAYQKERALKKAGISTKIK